MSADAWDFWIDRGGTFTDIVARDPEGALHRAKLLSENPEQYPDAALHGIRRFLGLGPEEPIPAARVASVKMGTTVATNALLERKGEPLVLVTTEGFAEHLRLAYQNRPRLFDRHIILPEMLYARVIEARERVRADGTVELPLDEDHLRTELETARATGLTACAVNFVHGYRHRAHEDRAGEIARDAGFTQVSVSHAVSPLMKMVSRGDTTVVDAYLTPILRRYIDRVAAAFEGDMTGRLMFMQSSGGLTDAALFQGKDAILSGPAGGVVGAVRTSQIAGHDRIIGFDMGGTSTDVCHFAGEFERVLNTAIAGVRVTAPMMNIHTVAAGGGSLLTFDGARMRVGPESAGADPGPAAYGRGGPLAVTDANVLTGRLRPDFFPAIFGPDADRPLDIDATRAAFESLASEIGKPPEEVAEGFLRIAVENMANAIKTISVQRGYDVTDYCLTVFGGAGAQHACAIADSLGMSTCLIHPMASLLSAYGMGLADIRATRTEALEADLDDTARLHAAAMLDGLGVRALGEVEAQGVPERQIRLEQILHLKVKGTDTALPVAFAPLDTLQAAFAEAHRARFGFDPGEAVLVIESVQVEAIGAAADLTEAETATETRSETDIATALTAPVFLHGGWHEARFVTREALRPGDTLTGPAVLVEPHTSILIEPGWQARITGHDHVELKRITARPSRTALGTEADPVMLEVFNNLYMSIAEQMGAVLENTAVSVTIKERLDFSCAVFDASGDLIANAPHMPVHLGSMGASVKAIIAQNPDMAPGDVYVLNAPYNGGTHLPDITAVMPVWDDAGETVLFYTSARGHHTDVGGLTPGSMPPDSRTIHDEGAYIDNWKLVEAGRFREAETRDLLLSAKYPVRAPDINIADLKAQVAACEKGARELRRMVAQFGLPGRAGLHGPCAGQCRGERAPRHRGAVGRGIRLSDGRRFRRHAARHPRRDPRGPRDPHRDHRFHRHHGAARHELQRPRAGDPGRGALRLPLPRRRQHPDERGRDETARGHPAPRHHALARLPGGGDRRQCRDQPGRHLGAVPRPRRAGGRAIDHEQHHLGQRDLPVLRDGLRRHRRGQAGRRLRPSRHLGRAQPHDQFAAHRSRSARMALPGRARGVPHPRRLRRGRALPRRRRHHPAHPLSRGHDPRHPRRPSHGSAAGPRGW